MTRQRTPNRVAFRRPWPGTRRGLGLWLLGLAVMIVGGVNYITTTVPERTMRSLWIPLSITDGNPVPWGILMVLVGGAAVFTSYCHFGRDRIGYALIAALCAGWGFAYLAGPAVSLIGDLLGYEALPNGGFRSIGSSAIWLLFAGLAINDAGYPNVRLGAMPPITEDDGPASRPTEPPS